MPTQEDFEEMNRFLCAYQPGVDCCEQQQRTKPITPHAPKISLGELAKYPPFWVQETEAE